MAASKAPKTITTASNVSSTSSSSSSLAAINTNDIGHNFHELCRSCGKTNAELYDLFQTTNLPFSTSSTTCYTHLNNCSTSSTSSPSTTNKPSTSSIAVGCAKLSAVGAFDSVAATAKATAKGQSNMDNILQEMQIWQLMIKCNDGLPQRICAKCTAQFYMIHKFRRKCLKVQTQLRALYEEQQKFYESRQQQQKEKNVTVKEDVTIEDDEEEATSTPVSTVPVVEAQTQLQPTNLVVEIVKPPVMHKVNDLVNDNYSETQQAIVVDNTNTKSSVPFEANTGNTNDFIAPTIKTTTTTLLDNVETMPQKIIETKTEANEPTPTSSAPGTVTATATETAFIDKTFETHEHEHSTGTTQQLRLLKDEKKPLLKPAVLNSQSLPPLTLQQPLEQICDNDALEVPTNPSKKPCLDQEAFLETHIIFKSSMKKEDLKFYLRNEQTTMLENHDNSSGNLSPCVEGIKANKTFQLSKQQTKHFPKDSAFSKANSESLFITKAALKSYTISPATSECENRDHHQKPITNSVAAEEAKNNNDNNNNDHKNIYDNQEELNDNTCSSSTTATTPCSSPSLYRTLKRRNICKRKMIKYSNHNSRPGHCYKSNAKTAKIIATTTTKKARTILNYGSELFVKRKPRSRQNKHKLKRLTNATTTATTKTSSISSPSIGLRKKLDHKGVKINHKKSSDEMSSTVSTTSSSNSPTSSCSPSSSAMSSTTSSPLRAIAPAVTDLVGNNRNAQENMTKTGCSSSSSSAARADILSSNMTCIMWKTKAAMKANANDMTANVDVNVLADNVDDGEPTCNIPEITLPYKASTTTTGSTSFLLSSGLAVDKSSKTLNENQSISKSCCSSNNNNILMEEYCLTNKVMSSSAGNQVKDTEDESEKQKTPKCNLWPEEADQNQIEANTPKEKQNAIKLANKKEFMYIEGNKEQNIEEDNKEKQKQKPIILTPPAKIGSMKLIIQRKRGARFKCRRKEDDDVDTNTKHDNHESTTPKRKRKSTHTTSFLNKIEMFTCDYRTQDEELSAKNKDTKKVYEEPTLSANRVPEFNSKEDENKENPIAIVNNDNEFDSDSNVSVYRDPLLIRNEMLEEDTNLTDFPKTQLSLQTECSKEMYKLYKEKINLESPKKLMVRVPLTSLTQEFKRLHLTMEDQENENEDEDETKFETTNKETPQDLLTEESNKEENVCKEKMNQQEELPLKQEPTLAANSVSSQSDLLGFSQSSETSSQPSIEMVRYVEPPQISASSKITDFINDFQNNCIDSSEIEDACDMIPTLGPQITQELSDEIRDVEDTLNGILSEMHDKDMYTPRSGETEEFFAHSVYSPLTDSATTPSQSFYAESPCTINSNPMSVSPFIHHNMDYNAMTPQSSHSSSMGPGSCYMGGGGSTGPHTVVFSEHYPSYNECFEESNQSELIGFQNDIPCFENIEISTLNNPNEPLTVNPGVLTEEEEEEATDNNNINSANENCAINQVEVNDSHENVEYVDLCNQPSSEQVESLEEVSVTNSEIQTQPITYNPTNYQPTNIQMLSSTNSLTHPHYIVTNTNQGPIIIANPQLNRAAEPIESHFKPHSNNLQFVTLGQAMEANQTASNQLINNNPTEINWSTSITTTPSYNQQPVIPTATRPTTTYFINSNGELYQANVPSTSLQNPSVSTIFVPPNTAQGFSKSNMDNNDNFIQTLPQQQQQQQTQPTNNRQSSQYIMLVNNLGGTPQYYATTHPHLNKTITTPQTIPQQTVLFHPAAGQSVRTPTNYQKIPTTETNSTAFSIQNTQSPVAAPSETPTDSSNNQTEHQRINQQLQKQIKQRQLQILQPRSPNLTQKITLVCRYCHKRPKFTNNVDYSNHIINTHPAEKPFNCPHCPMHFTRRTERQNHVTRAHCSRYQCAQCGLGFGAQRTLDFHLQKYHANLGRSHQHLLQQQQQQQQQNSTSTALPATYQLLQHNHQQRLVRVEDVHVQVTGENKNKRSIDLTLESSVDIKASQSLNEVETLSHTTGTPQQQTRKLCCPDCDGDNNDCCSSNQNQDQNDNNSNEIQTPTNNPPQYAGNESVNNHLQHPQHVTIPSPEQTEPDSTTTLRYFRKRQLCDVSPSQHFASASPSSSSSSSSSSTFSLNNNAANNNGDNDNNNINLNRNSPHNDLTGCGGSGGSGGKQIIIERTLRGSHNCLLCEESFTNEIALRKHHHLAHGAAIQATSSTNGSSASTATTSSSSMSSSLVCTICKRGFRMRNALQRHMETHDAEGRPYECNICQVRFPRPSQLTLHKLTVHKFEKPISCEECGKQFGTESAIKAHAAEHVEAANATTSEASTSSSSQQQLSSCIYMETMTTNTTSLSTSTANEHNNIQNINSQSTTSGEESTVSIPLTNNNQNILNNVTQNTNGSGLIS